MEPMNVDGEAFAAMIKAKVLPAIRAAYYNTKRSVILYMNGHTWLAMSRRSLKLNVRRMATR